jgi:anti-sigma factor (TIGR02949 family)
VSGVTKYGCLEAFQRLDDYLDRELSPEEMELVKAHLETCKVCAMEFEFEAEVLERVKEKIRRVDLPPDLISRVLGAIQKASGER